MSNKYEIAFAGAFTLFSSEQAFCINFSGKRNAEFRIPPVHFVGRERGRMRRQAGVTAASNVDAGTRPPQTGCAPKGGGRERAEVRQRETAGRGRERVREWLEVGPVIVLALILDQFTGYTRVCARTLRRDAPSRTQPTL